uniref:hypothetical protein n=1 Tax=Candidatus Fimivicinus sp. TaxID=3056640 RepID=UPI003FF08BCA
AERALRASAETPQRKGSRPFAANIRESASFFFLSGGFDRSRPCQASTFIMNVIYYTGCFPNLQATIQDALQALTR